MADPLYLQSPYVWVLFATAGVLAGREVIARWLWRAETDTRIDRSSFGVLWASTVVGVAVALFVPFTGVGAVGAARLAFWIGIALMLAGFAFRLWAMLTLGRLFTHRVAVKADHEVIESGPYRLVRHPAYAGATVTYLGIGVVSGNWIGILAALAGPLVGYGYRIRVEERALRERLPEYEAYAERTPYRLIPGVW